MKSIKTRVWTVTCPGCQKEIYSRAGHDYRTCGCPQQTMVDGGFSGYVRYGGQSIAVLRTSFRHRFIKASKQELYDDWNKRLNRFGVIAVKGVK
jgi:hypothetical protein